MEVSLEPGRYVVAVSGGVDSVVLLDLLRKQPDLELAVAHFDHGIRPDSITDRKFVESLAKHYGLSFRFADGQLGPTASEESARTARYEFLKKVMAEQQAKAIITAHHQDDVLETAIINMLRGTGRKGLSALGNSQYIKRPLLSIPKADIVAYAKKQKLDWHEDVTNQDERYLRNYVRHKLLKQFSMTDRARLLESIEKLRLTNKQIDELLVEQIVHQEQLRRAWFNQLPHDLAMEVMASWLRQNDIRAFDKKTLQRLVVAAKTGRNGSQVDVLADSHMQLSKENLTLKKARWQKKPSGV